MEYILAVVVLQGVRGGREFWNLPPSFLDLEWWAQGGDEESTFTKVSKRLIGGKGS